MEAILAIDGGATRTRCVAIARSGEKLAECESGASNQLQADDEMVHERLSGIVQETLRRANLQASDVRCLSAGLAGVDYDGYGQEPMLELFRNLGFENSLVYGDIVIAHAGALGLAPGIVILAGTGSAIFGMDSFGRWAKVGGWGPIYGDEGSGLRIAQRALTAAARAYDGRGPATALLETVTNALAIRDFRESISVIYGSNRFDVASLCPAVYQTMMEGDAVADSLFHEAAAELAESVAAAARRLALENAPLAISYQGGVMENCPLLLERIKKRLSERLPLARLQPPLWKPVTGAYLLACRSLGWEPDFKHV